MKCFPMYLLQVASSYNLSKISVVAAYIFVLQGCMVTPTVLTNKEIQSRIDHDLVHLTKDQEPVTGPIDLFEAMARALKYNLETKVEVMKTMLAHQQLDLSHYDLLPKLVANANYDGRDNFSGARSRSLLSGQTSLEPSTSAEKNIFNADLTLSWDVLDFGLSYVRAQQAADNVLIAEEEKRRVANRVMQEVRTAYWRAVSADRMLGRLALLEEWVSRTIHDLTNVRERQLESPLASLQYQRELLATKSEIQKLHHKLSLARIELAELMNLKPGQSYELVQPSRDLSIPDISAPVTSLEYQALLNRPELRTVDYRKRINAKETKAALLEMLPNLNLQFGPNYSSNSFLFNNHWLSYGAKVSWNLLNVFRKPAQFSVINMQEKILDTQSVALTMAILSQVHVSLAQLVSARTEMLSTKTYFETQQQIGIQVQHSWKVNRMSEQTLIRERLNNVLAELRHEAALAECETAYANLLAAVGAEALPQNLTNVTVVNLARGLRTRWELQTAAQEHVKAEKPSEHHVQTIVHD